MHTSYLICVLVSWCSFYDVIVARTTPNHMNDVTPQSDDPDRKQNALNTLEDVKSTTNNTFNMMCIKFCTENGQTSSYCHDIQVTASSLSHLSSTSLISSGTEESQLSSMVRVSGEYENEVAQMALTAQKRECHLYWQQNRECPLSRDHCETEQSRDTQYCRLKRLGSDIGSFNLIVKQMMVSEGYPLPTAVAPTPIDDVINDVTVQDQRDLLALSMAATDWDKMLNTLRTLY